MQKVVLITDGACSGNPGPGGWACIIQTETSDEGFCGPVAMTTNNVMELEAILQGLRRLPEPAAVQVLTDSNNAIGWLQGGWKRKVETIRAKCEEIETAISAGGHQVTFKKVAGHAGHPLNERCDKMAVAARDLALKGVRGGSKVAANSG